MQQRRTFTEDFKRDAVRLAKERGNTSAVARDLGIHESLLSKWKHKLEVSPERPFPGQGNPQDVELAALKRENTRLKEENEILKRYCVVKQLLSPLLSACSANLHQSLLGA